MDGIDFSKINIPTPSFDASMFSAMSENLERAQQSMEAMGEYNAKKDAALFETAEASKAQKELLEVQLEEVKEQNNQLKENYRLLNEMYEKAKKEAKENKIFGWTSFGVGTLIGIAGVAIGIIF